MMVRWSIIAVAEAWGQFRNPKEGGTSVETVSRGLGKTQQIENT
jgi:hypothetical protein